MTDASASDWEKAYRRVELDAAQALQGARDAGALEAFRVEFLGRSGRLSMLLRGLKDLPLEARRTFGEEANKLRVELEAKVEALKVGFDRDAIASELAQVKEDLSLPARPFPRGRRHVLTLTMERMAGALSRLGFSWAEGPLVESDWFNFEALNIPPEHPARDQQDTYYADTKDEHGRHHVLRTHTSPVQIRAMKARTSSSRTPNPPIRIMAPGRVFRHEAVDVTHSHAFHQVEGLYVDKGVSMADLKGTLELFMKELFGPDVRIRFTPSYFPFVEPGAGVDVSCMFCKGTGALPGGEGCAVCKRSGWLELLGAGMVHPKVLEAGGYDPKEVTGYAFGIGVERVAMMLFGISDIRHFYENDLRFLSQFG